MRSRTKIVIAAGLVAIVAAMIYVAVSANTVTCEVCIELDGRSECRKGSGKSVEEARTAAADTACWVLGGGVTDGMVCKGSKPKSVSCRERQEFR